MKVSTKTRRIMVAISIVMLASSIVALIVLKASNSAIEAALLWNSVAVGILVAGATDKPGIALAVAVILGTVGCMAYTGAESSKSYYVKVPELLKMGDVAYKRSLRVDGFVVPGSIERNGPNVDFVLNEYESHSPKAASGLTLKVSYRGAEPPPDTFKDDSEAVADGTYGRDGVFHATGLQAKCASKYAPAQPGAQPPAPASTRPSTASNPASAPPSSTQTASN